MNYLVKTCKNVYHRFTYEFYGVPESHGEMQQVILRPTACPSHWAVHLLNKSWRGQAFWSNAREWYGYQATIFGTNLMFHRFLESKPIHVLFLVSDGWRKVEKRPSKIHHISGECTSFLDWGCSEELCEHFHPKVLFNKFTMKILALSDVYPPVVWDFVHQNCLKFAKKHGFIYLDLCSCGVYNMCHQQHVGVS